MSPKFFASQSQFRAWMEKNHDGATELLIGFYKTSAKLPGMTYKEALDVALCFGWIDGVRKNIDENSYSIRFSPRTKSSIWSQVNIKRMNELMTASLAHPAGIRTFNERDPKKEKLYAFEQEHPIRLNKEYEQEFRASPKAWQFFTAQAPSYQKTAIWYVMQAKQPATQLRRLGILIAASLRQERIR